MKDVGKMVTLGLAGCLLYAGSAAASSALQDHFWTSRTIRLDVPWYYLGEAFLDGACAAVALTLLVPLGILAKRKLGPRAWPMLLPSLGYLAVQVGEGLAVLLFTQRIWAGPSEASTSITTFDQYLHVTSVAAYVTMACVFIPAILILRRTKVNDGAAHKGISE